MTLYHATRQDNLAAIEFDGLVPSGADDQEQGYTRLSRLRGVYGFTCTADAESFAYDNNLDVILAFATDGELEVVPDPEYDAGVAYIVIPSASTIKGSYVAMMLQ